MFVVSALLKVYDFGVCGAESVLSPSLSEKSSGIPSSGRESIHKSKL